MDKIAKAKVVVVFVDLRGSSRWTRRMADDEVKREAFMLAYDKECLYYRARTHCEFYKRIGDGRMLVHVLNGRNHSEVASEILNEALGLIKRVDRLITKLPAPRPAGFRMRIMSGIVHQEIYPDGEQDWVGYIPNTCHKLQSVCPVVPLLLSEAFMETIKRGDAKKNGFTFTLLTGERLHPDGVDQEDVDSLWVPAKRRPV